MGNRTTIHTIALMEDIRSLSSMAIPELFPAREEAFKDYGMPMALPDLEKMLCRRGYAPALFYGVFEGDKLVSFTLNCVGSYNGKTTIYDTSTGTIEKYRGRGLATKILEHSFPVLQQAGAEQYLL